MIEKTARESCFIPFTVFVTCNYVKIRVARVGKTDMIGMEDNLGVANAHRSGLGFGLSVGDRGGTRCGICPDVAPEIFEMRSDDKAHTKVDPIPEELQAACKDAADQCPQAAIEVE